jgi:hypothetical protein
MNIFICPPPSSLKLLRYGQLGSAPLYPEQLFSCRPLLYCSAVPIVKFLTISFAPGLGNCVAAWWRWVKPFCRLSITIFHNGPGKAALYTWTCRKDLECHLALCWKLLTDICHSVPVLPVKNALSHTTCLKPHESGKPTLNQLYLRPKSWVFSPFSPKQISIQEDCGRWGRLAFLL